ncbi:DNA polymerase III subunit gamma/tau [Parabacteroides sp. PF5-9]|uniref:DNA polymerase III subunit gamma/tau n=1 Tax=Parabacteroides sp. PF5-9 TaxID=1742404 RepID=UPI002475FB5D|nr:DNA polymerase III subunit gamma/tau [Parabacteroides sp. PF5-9]MDH6358670.1 DNA polymerase-3 subunit gamma/tau [Parabacteroides sp. PF5-9]
MDNYIVSARKYRPSTFQSVVGQKALTITLKNAIQSNKLAHAYLFCGPRGVGKTSCARIFAKTINCLTPTIEGEACNSCESCVAFNEQRSYNIHELDAASNNSVDDIRSLIDQVRIPPPISKYKVFIIDEVHMLSSAAFNAFLKTLEEPPHHAVFILATTEKHKVLPTILSRCQIYDFSRISIADMVEHLQYVATGENVTAELDALNVIAQKADGGMRDALSIFDQVASFTNGHITYQAVINNLNVLDYEYYFRLTAAILKGEVREAVLILNEVLLKGFDGQHFITGLAGHFRDLLVCKDESTLVLFEVGASIRERYMLIAKACSDQLLFKAIELANNCDLNYRLSRNKRLLLELTLIQLCQLNMPTTSTEDAKKKRVIEPIASQEQPQQSPNTVSQKVDSSTPQPQVVTTQMPSTSITSEQSSTVSAKKNGRPPIGTSLKEIVAEKPKEQFERQVNETAQEIITPFTEEDLVNSWDAYTQIIDKKVFLKTTMINCKPVLQEDYSFEVAVHNPPQQEELINGAIDILTYLRQQLNNNKIQMRVRVSETNEKQLAYTSSEKYEYLLSVNPALGKLRDEFNLTID